jgi:hypothetical protein
MNSVFAPFLAPDEQLIGAVATRSAVAAPGISLPAGRRMALAITSQRLLIAQRGGRFRRTPATLVAARPIADVHQIAVSERVSTKAVTLHVAGVAIGVETARREPAEVLPHALMRAQSAT